MNTTKKITKRDSYNALAAIVAAAADQGFVLPEGITFDGLNDFITHEIELLENKAAAAAKRAADKKVEGDELRDKIYNVLSDTDFTSVDSITAALGDPDVSKQMVTSRLTQLKNLGKAEAGTVTITLSDGKTRKASAYRKVTD